MATPSRMISARPRVASAALALSPSSRAQATPTAMAMTFFTAAPISTPNTSPLV